MNEVECANVKVIQRLYDLINLGDLDAINRLVRADIVVEEPDGMPYGGHYAGLDDYRKLFGKLADTWSEFTILKSEFLTRANRVLSVLQLHVRSKATGASLDVEVAELWDLEDGLITRVQPFYFDTHALRILCGLS